MVSAGLIPHQLHTTTVLSGLSLTDHVHLMQNKPGRYMSKHLTCVSVVPYA